MDEIVDEAGRAEYQCNDTSYCDRTASGNASVGAR